MLKRCLLVKKLLENGECNLSKELSDFLQSGVVEKKGRTKLKALDFNFLQSFFNSHCKDIVEKYGIISNIGVYPVNIKSLNNCFKLYSFLEKNREIEDLRIISTKVFNNSKTIYKSSILKKIVQHFFDKVKSFYNIIFLKCSSKIYFDNEDISQIMTKNNFFACFSHKLEKIKFNTKYVVIFENLSPFFLIKPSDALFIYCSGFQNISIITSQLKNIANKNIVHFGDVDPSGLSIADILLSENENAKFYPDISTVKNVLSLNPSLISAEKEYLPDIFKADILKDIAKLMKSKNNIRIEQEFIFELWRKGVVKIPNWAIV